MNDRHEPDPQEQVVHGEAPHAHEPSDDFTVFKEGDVFTPLNIPIHKLSGVERNYIVFLDAKYDVHHYYIDFEVPDAYGSVSRRETNLEVMSALLLKDRVQLFVCRSMLGESFVRLFDDGDAVNANVVLDQAEAFLSARSRERARIWSLASTALTTVLLGGLGFLLFWALRGRPATAELSLAAGAGTLGAFVSVLLRSANLGTDVFAGSRVHYVDGAMRVVVGAAAGLIFTLAIKADLLLGLVNRSENRLAVLAIVALVAGASERLLPSLIRQLEGKLVSTVDEIKIDSTSGAVSTRVKGRRSTHVKPD
jgi:hypothetical protein